MSEAKTAEMLREIKDGVTSQGEAQEAFEASLAERQAKDDAKFAELAESVDSVRALAEDLKETGKSRSLALGIDKKEAEKYDIGRAIFGFTRSGNPERDCPLEWEMHRSLLKEKQKEIERRLPASQVDIMDRLVQGERSDVGQRAAMLSTGASTGGFLIPEEASGRFYDIQRAQMVTAQAGVTKIQASSYPWTALKQTGDVTASRRGETQTVSETSVALGKISAEPKGLMARVVLTTENLMFAGPELSGIVNRSINAQMALRKDRDILAGSGGGNTPLGVLNTTGVVDQALAGGSPRPMRWTDGIKLEAALQNNNAYVDDGSLGFISRPGVFTTALQRIEANYSGQTEDANAGYAWRPGTKPADMLNHPAYFTTQLPDGEDSGSTTLAFGRWSDVLHIQFGGMLVKESDVATDGTLNALTNGYHHIVAMEWDDVAVARPTSIVYSDDMDHA